MDDDAVTFWDAQAEAFDEEADHGLRDPGVREAWRRLLLPRLPAPGADVVDVGCGTGSLSCLLAQEGYAVRGVDLAPRMVAAARAKAAALGVGATFTVGDAADPPVADASADIVLVRHVLWAMPDPDAAVARWLRLLRPSGRLLLVEGRWHTGGGLSAEQTRAVVARHRSRVVVEPLPDEALWGGPISDERYVVVSES
jgi:ubiquinone/menaquinone biosynthesis C-methylase UbiE